VYALEILLIAVITRLFVSYFVLTTPSRGQLVGFALLTSLSLYTQYYIGLLLAAFCVPLLVTGRYRPLRNYLFAMVLAGIASVPIFLWLPGQLDDSDGVKGNPFSLAESIRFAFGTVRSFVYPATIHFQEKFHASGIAKFIGLLVKTVIVAFLVAGSVAVSKLHPPFRKTTTAFWWSLFIALAVLFSAVGAVTSRHLVLPQRYWVLMVVPSALATLAIAGELRQQLLLKVLVLAIIGGNLLDAWFTFRGLAKYGDAKRVASVLSSHVMPNESIAVFPNREALVLEKYYHGPNRLIALPRPARLDKWDLRNDIAQSETELREAIDIHVPNKGKLWLVFQPIEGAVDTNHHHGLVEGYFERCFEELNRWYFVDHLTVRELRRRAWAPGCQ
jgi:hypothetical protein